MRGGAWVDIVANVRGAEDWPGDDPGDPSAATDETLGHSRILTNGRRNLVISQKSIGGGQLVDFSAEAGIV